MEAKNFNFNRKGLFLFILFLLFTNFICLYLLFQLHYQFEQQSFLIENFQTRLDLLTVSLEETNQRLLDAELRKTKADSTKNVLRWFDFSYFNVLKTTK